MDKTRVSLSSYPGMHPGEVVCPSMRKSSPERLGKPYTGHGRQNEGSCATPPNAAYAALKERHKEAGQPGCGWVFRSSSREGHFNKDTAKDRHAKAVERVNNEAKKSDTRKLNQFPAVCSTPHCSPRNFDAKWERFWVGRIGNNHICLTLRSPEVQFTILASQLQASDGPYTPPGTPTVAK